LFSGIGGFHLGLERAGFEFESVKFSEIDKHAISIYQRRFPDAEYIGSVTDVHGQRGEADIITFGSPCQDFSIAGKRAGMDGQRSSLITHAIRLIDEVRPDFFIWENVKGTFSSNNGADFWAIIQAFTDLGGYRYEWQLLNTAWFLPQNRERIYLVGYNPDRSRGEIFPIPEPGEITNKRNTEKQIATALQSPGHAAGNYRGMNMVQTLQGGDTLNTIRSGGRGSLTQKHSWDTVKVQPILTPDRLEKRQNGRRFKENNEPMFTLTGQDKHGVMIRDGRDNRSCLRSGRTPEIGYSGQSIRRLTPIECERLQGFPDNWTEGISDTQRYKTLGNAVSVPVVKAVGKQIKRSLQDVGVNKSLHNVNDGICVCGQ
jgi:DNA (cytosine-5)-methyltransferase 1